MNQQVVTQPSSVPGDLLMSDEHFAILQKYRPQEERWQLIDGIPFMMTPATNRHQRLCLQLANLLNDGIEQARPDLIALTERGLLVPGVPRFRPIADVAVVLNDDGVSYNDRFFLAGEVLSPSNSEEYIEIKRIRYMQHPDNLYALMVSQDERKVEIWSRGSGGHLLEKEGLRAVIDLPEFGARFTLAALYKGTPLGG